MEAIQHTIEYFGDYTFEIKTLGGEQFTVDLPRRYCACMKWELCGLPCSHAMACILNKGLNPIQSVHA